MKVAVFVTPHGFGHAGRAAAVMEALGAAPVNGRSSGPVPSFELLTTVPEVFFRDSLPSVSWRHHPLACDVGLRQASALEIDLEGTRRALDDFLDRLPALVETAAGIIRETGCDLTLSDISPLGILAAERAGVPSVLVENFTWDWIYEGLAREAPDLEKHGAWLARVYARADLRLQPEPVCRPVSGAHVVPPVARSPRSPGRAVRRELGISGPEPVVLVTMGGTGQDLPALRRLKEVEATVLLTGMDEGGRDGNLVRFRRGDVVYLPDLIAASDLVVSKLGYSTVAEVWLQDRPLLYVGNDRFREVPVLRDFVHEELEAREISMGALEAGDWVDAVAAWVREGEGAGAASGDGPSSASVAPAPAAGSRRAGESQPGRIGGAGAGAGHIRALADDAVSRSVTPGPDGEVPPVSPVPTPGAGTDTSPGGAT